MNDGKESCRFADAITVKTENKEDLKENLGIMNNNFLGVKYQFQESRNYGYR